VIAPQQLHNLLEHVGVGFFAMSGALASGRKRLDLIGVFVVAVMTAVGGGTLRDLLLGRHPIFWIAEPSYLSVILGAVVFTVVLTRFRPPPLGALLVFDALGLALFTISGARIAEGSTSSAAVVILMGGITGAAGGALRDILCNEIPLVMRSGHLYASAALVGAAVYHWLSTRGVAPAAASAAGMGTVAALRLAAIVFGIKLPVYELESPARGAKER
jgi:uncharacterized membrane protein YeiH